MISCAYTHSSGHSVIHTSVTCTAELVSLLVCRLFADSRLTEIRSACTNAHSKPGMWQWCWCALQDVVRVLPGPSRALLVALAAGGRPWSACQCRSTIPTICAECVLAHVCVCVCVCASALCLDHADFVHMLHLWDRAGFLKTASVGCSSTSASSAPCDVNTSSGPMSTCASAQYCFSTPRCEMHIVVNLGDRAKNVITCALTQAPASTCHALRVKPSAHTLAGKLSHHTCLVTRPHMGGATGAACCSVGGHPGRLPDGSTNAGRRDSL